MDCELKEKEPDNKKPSHEEWLAGIKQVIDRSKQLEAYLNTQMDAVTIRLSTVKEQRIEMESILYKAKLIK